MYRTLEELAQEINERSDYRADVKQIWKNGKEVNAMNIVPAEGNLGAIFYDEEMMLNSSVQDMIDKTDEALSIKPEYGNVKDFIENWEEIKNKIQYKLLPTLFYHEEIKSKNLIHTEYGTLTEIYYLRVDEEGIIPITESLRDLWGIEEKRIRDCAHFNIRRTMEIIDMEIMLSNILGIEDVEENHSGMKIVTNKNKMYGACYLSDPVSLEAISYNTGWNSFYILPISIHELIIIEDKDGMQPEELKTMVQEVNDKEVSEHEILSYNVYKYEYGTLKIM